MTRWIRRTVTGGTLLLTLVATDVTTLQAQNLPTPTPDEHLDSGGTDIVEAVRTSFRLAVLQHAFRIGLEAKTRAELGGSFFGDYRRSLRLPRRWGDGDTGKTNYIGHPAQGAASGFIWLQNDARAPKTFTLRREYWSSRLRAMGWAAGYSVQFEIGPFSEASIGNVGLAPTTAGWVDHVVTPTGGLAMMVGEDVIDRFVLVRLERRTSSPVLRSAMRMVLNPSRAMSNAASLRAPWHRTDRRLDR